MWGLLSFEVSDWAKVRGATSAGFLREGGSGGVCDPKVRQIHSPQYSLRPPKLPEGSLGTYGSKSGQV